MPSNACPRQECDFVVCEGNKVRQCIQVSYDVTTKKTRKREISDQMLAHHKTGCSNLLLFTDHQHEETEKAGLCILIKTRL
ncbi:MAG: hypothetical protein PUF44_05140 [Bacteroidales bacterium]|nr:hypothetical protein [Bacteroidales bacterium]